MALFCRVNEKVFHFRFRQRNADNGNADRLVVAHGNAAVIAHVSGMEDELWFRRCHKRRVVAPNGFCADNESVEGFAFAGLRRPERDIRPGIKPSGQGVCWDPCERRSNVPHARGAKPLLVVRLARGRSRRVRMDCSARRAQTSSNRRPKHHGGGSPHHRIVSRWGGTGIGVPGLAKEKPGTQRSDRAARLRPGETSPYCSSRLSSACAPCSLKCRRKRQQRRCMAAFVLAHRFQIF